MVIPQQGDIWWAEAEDQRRPVLIVTRSDVLPHLDRYVVAPVTRTVRSIPTEVALGPEEGLSEECVASFDNLQPVSASLLSDRLGRLSMHRQRICGALAALSDC